MRALKAGADDFLTKPVASQDLLPAIERAFARHQTSRELQNKQEFARAHVGTLTPREREVFDLIIRGRTNKQIGPALGATVRTIKANRNGVMEKIQVRSLPELVSLPSGSGSWISHPTAERRPDDRITSLRRWLYQQEPRPQPYLSAAPHVVLCDQSDGRHAADVALHAAPDAAAYQLSEPQHRTLSVPQERSRGRTQQPIQ